MHHNPHHESHPFIFVASNQPNQGRTLTPEDLVTLATELGNNRKFLVLDTNVILCQMDLLEKGGEAISCMIVLGTVMSEVRRQNLSLHLRLTRLLKKEDRAFVFLANEHHRYELLFSHYSSPNPEIRIFLELSFLTLLIYYCLTPPK